jgi:methionyl-tRNA formyltransferase
VRAIAPLFRTALATLPRFLPGDRRASVSTMLAMATPVLIGFMGLAIDTTSWETAKVSLQGATDQAAIAAGDAVTGATTFLIEPALDSGPVYGVLTETIRPTDTAGELLERLSVAGGGLLEATVDGIADGALNAVPQPGDGISVAPKVTVEQARVRWDLPAQVIERTIRAFTPNPGAWTMIADMRIKLGPVSVDPDSDPLEPGAIRVDRAAVRVGTGTHPVLLGQLQPPGKKPMAAADWARGARLPVEVRAS